MVPETAAPELIFWSGFAVCALLVTFIIVLSAVARSSQISREEREASVRACHADFVKHEGEKEV